MVQSLAQQLKRTQTKTDIKPYKLNDTAQYNITHTHPFNGPFSGTTPVSRYKKGKTNLDFTEARDSEWRWHQLGHMQVCTSLQTDNHASTPPLSFIQAGCPSCRATNSVKALKADTVAINNTHVSHVVVWLAAGEGNSARFHARRRTVEVDILFPVIVVLQTTAVKLQEYQHTLD